MQVLRLNEVLTRVVAWHNRHPLARRIQATQVHSIGEVLLPFASALPLVGTTAPAPAPAPVRAPAPTSAPAAAAAPKAGGSLADVVSARAAARPAAAAAAAVTATATATAPGWAPHSVSPEVLADPAGATDLDPFAPESAAGIAPASAVEGGRDDEPAPTDSLTDPITGQSPDQKADPALHAAAPAAAAAPPLSDSDSDSGSNPDPDPDSESESESDSDSSPAAAAAVAFDTATPARAVASVNVAPDIDLASGLDEPPQFNAASANKAANAPDPAVQPPAPDIDVSSPPAAAPAAGLSGPAWPAAASVGWLCRIARRIGMHRTGRRPGWPRLEAAFSRDFIWPLTPQQVARWAQRHGRAQSMAPADWPRRQVAPDPALAGPLRQAGLPHTVQLHLLTAAIGVGDRRIRVLMDGDGRILGPRAYSRPRSASAAVLLLAGLLGAGWQWAVPTSADGGGKAARLAQVAEAASAASAGSAVAAVAAVSAVAAASAASAAATTAAASVVALAASTASAPATVLPASTTTASATAFITASNTASVAAPITAPITAPPTAPVTAATTASITEATPPAEPAADAPPLGRIRPALSDDERRIAKQQAVRLREAPGAAPATARAALAGAPPATVYAVVSRATGQRDAAARSLAVMRSARARLSSTASDRSELMQNQGQWRAAWWPFASPLDAERARSMLAARGLKAEVVAF